jgi:hypothetical protein
MVPSPKLELLALALLELTRSAKSAILNTFVLGAAGRRENGEARKINTCVRVGRKDFKLTKRHVKQAVRRRFAWRFARASRGWL